MYKTTTRIFREDEVRPDFIFLVIMVICNKLAIWLLLGPDLLEDDEVLLRDLGGHVHILRVHRHEVRLPVFDLVQTLYSVTARY